MFDLNLTVSSVESLCDGIDAPSDKLMELSGGQMENSGTSNSSVVNVDSSSTAGDEDSCSNHRFDGCEISFNILKRCGGENECGESENRRGSLTKEFFPVNAGQETLASSTLGEPCLDLIGSNVGFPVEQMIIAQQHRQQVKKSRRGPRSRSSQYRGVTFYRRTGRWESHIWYPFATYSFMCLIFSRIRN